MKHAPIHYVHNDSGLIYGQCTDDDAEAPFVADVIEDRERAAFGILTDREAANAAFIVAACNAHVDVVAALTSIQIVSRPHENNDHEHEALFDCHCLASNALAALKGGAA